jgi:MFS transporter, ACS family, tartrate transporter
VVLLLLTDRPGQAFWLDADERNALELELKREKEVHQRHGHMKLSGALRHPKVLALAAAYFFIVTGNYGVEFFLPSILKSWFNLSLDNVTWLVIYPPVGSLVGQLFIGWSSDRTGERRLHCTVPIYLGALALGCTFFAKSSLWLTLALFILAMTGLKAYLPAFWSLPSLFLTEAAAAGSIGLINSVGNLGGFLGPFLLGTLEHYTGSFQVGLLILCTSMIVSGTIILALGLGRHTPTAKTHAETNPMADAVIDPT